MTPRTALFSLSFAVALLAGPADGAIIPIGEMIANGEAAINASTSDIGGANTLVDGNWGNIYRSASVNPVTVLITFDEAQTVGAARGLFSHTQYYSWKLEAANSASALWGQSGDYVLLFGPEQVSGDGSEIAWEEWNDTPVERRYFQFTIERLTGDDYVHIHELELQTAELAEQVYVNGGWRTINTIEVSPPDAEIAGGTSVQYSAEASLSYGPDRYDVTDLVTWSSSDPSVVNIDADGLATAQNTGAVTISADIGVVHGQTPATGRVFRPADLNVGFIHRTPEYNRFKVEFVGDQHIHPSYVGEKKWPDAGEVVTYEAHIFNKGDQDANNVEYRWFFDDVEVASGVVATIAGKDKAVVSYSAPWPADTVQTVNVPEGAMDLHAQQLERAVGDHRIRCEVDPNDLVAETCEMNNAVEDYINAVAFWFFMDETTYGFFNKHKSFLESYSAEDWLQGQLEGFRRRLMAGGAEQPVRLAMVAIYPDGGLSTGGTHGPIGDEVRQADGQWGFQIAEWPESKVTRFAKIVENPLMHEWGHQIGLIDVYAYDISIDNCLITYGGSSVAGTALMPGVSPWNVYYGNVKSLNDGGTARVDDTDRALMANTSARFIAPGSAAGMNRNRGLRRGFYGDYLGAIQQGEIKLRVEAFGGAPVAGCNLRIFQRDTDGKVYDIPKFAGATNASGEWIFPNVTLPGWEGGISVNNPWSWKDGAILYDAPHAVGLNAPLVVELEFGGTVEYHFVEPDPLNIAMGAGVLGDYVITLTTYASRTPNNLPNISFSNGSNDVYLTEGERFEAVISANDPDGDPVTLSATPLHNAHFDPATGKFVFWPDSLQTNQHDGYTETLAVTFRADDGKFRSKRVMRFYVSDDPAQAWINRGGNVLLGDMNCDGAVNTRDIDGFVAAMISEQDYAVLYPNCLYALGDCNGDGAVNSRDIDAFVALLTS